MSTVTLKQGEVVATVSDLNYRPATGGVERDVAYVLEEIITGETDIKLQNGPADLSYNGAIYPVKVTTFEVEEIPGEDPDDREDSNTIELNVSQGGLARLADALGLLEHYSRRQKKGLFTYNG